MSRAATTTARQELPAPADRLQWRWVALSVFILADMLNFLDRQLLAALGPTIRSEFHLSNAQFGSIISAFSIVYMVAVPVMGFVVDRFGGSLCAMIGVTAWSLAGAATGWVQSFRGLVICRMVLGLAETGGISSAGKIVASYLKPREFGLGTAFNSLGFSTGAILAPLVVAAVVPSYGWRSAFVFCGLLGLAWVPLWFATSRSIPPTEKPLAEAAIPFRDLLSDRRLWLIAGANILVMTPHSLWFNWTTIYFVQQHHLTQLEANRYVAWIPPIFGTLGGLTGGWLALRWIKSGQSPVAARLRIAVGSAVLLLMIAVIPFIHSTPVAAAAVSLSFFLVMTILSNLHAVPIDLFGVKHAAFTTSMLAFSYALLQAIFSPIVGFTVDHFGFGAVCMGISALPLIGVVIIRRSVRE